MKKGYYFAQNGLVDNLNTGVGKKILYQINALKQSNIDCEFIPLSFRYRSKIGCKIFSRLPFGYTYDWRQIEKYKNADFLYIRKTLIDYHLYKTIKKIKKNSSVKILFEIPTYPYYKEFLGFDKFYLLKDMFWRRKILKIVDKVYLYGTPDTQIKEKYIALKNAINVSDVPPKINVSDNFSTINMISVSTMCFWHGYDRLIEGAYKYYQNHKDVKVLFHMVGYGPEEQKYKELVKKYNLSEYFIFYGKQSGTKLNDIYNKADIGLEGFGFHRKGLMSSTSLKSLEYAAKGIPFITSTPNDNFINSDFVFCYEAGESPIDIDQGVTFYFELCKKYGSKNALRDAIRRYTEHKCNFSVAMADIISFINNK